MFNYSKRTIFTLSAAIVVISVVIIGGGLLLCQYFLKIPQAGFTNKENQNIETADWQTYLNTEYGFEFKYPQNFGEITLIDNNPVGFGLGSKPILFKAHTSDYLLNIGVAGMDDFRFSNTGGEVTTFNKNQKKCEINEGEVEKETGMKFEGAEGCYVGDMDVRGGSIGYVIPNLSAQRVVLIQINFSDNELSFTDAKNIIKSIITAFKFTPKNLNAGQLFQEASSQLGFTRSQVVYFRIFGQDKIQYSFGSGTNYAYKTGGQWYLVGIGNFQDLPFCSEIISVPAQYNPGCVDVSTQKVNYLDAQKQSINYPIAQVLKYIGN